MQRIFLINLLWQKAFSCQAFPAKKKISDKKCDIFSIEDKTISLSSEEFQKYGDLKEEYFGILIKKNSNDFLIGSCDLCGCKIDSSFRQIKKSEDNFYKTINNIIESNIIY